MKIYKLDARRDIPAGLPDPWEPWYDKCFEMVVIAGSEEEARRLATAEGSNEIWLNYIEQTDPSNAWLDPRYSTCEEISEEKGARVLIMDIHNA